MDILIYSLIYSQWFWISVAIWAIIGFSWSARRKNLGRRILYLLKRPLVTKEDPDKLHNNEGFYPGKILVLFAEFIDRFKIFVAKGSDILIAGNPVRSLAYIILLMLFCAFVFSHWVAIAYGVATFFTYDALPTPLMVASYGFAVGNSTFLSLCVGFFVLNQARSDDPIMRWGGDTGRDSKKFSQWVSIVIVMIATLTMGCIGLYRMSRDGYFQPNSYIDFIYQFGVHVLILINSTLSAGLIFMEALFGILVLVLAFAWIIVAALTISRHIIDFAMRIIIIGFDLLIYFIFSPIFRFLEFVKIICKYFT